MGQQAKTGIATRAFICIQSKGPHLHVRDVEVGYLFRGLDSLRKDIIAMIKKEGFITDRPITTGARHES